MDKNKLWLSAKFMFALTAVLVVAGFACMVLAFDGDPSSRVAVATKSLVELGIRDNSPASTSLLAAGLSCIQLGFWSFLLGGLLSFLSWATLPSTQNAETQATANIRSEVDHE